MKIVGDGCEIEVPLTSPFRPGYKTTLRSVRKVLLNRFSKVPIFAGICLGGTDFTLHSPSDFRSSNHSATVVQNCPKCNSTAECQDSGAVCIETILSLPGCEQNSLPSEGYCQCAEHLLYVSCLVSLGKNLSWVGELPARRRG